jgi:hypothetical protein
MDLATLNRLRVNAGKPELKSWKASAAKLVEAAKVLTDAGFTDVVAGANVEAEPVTTDPEVAKALAPKEEPKKEEPEETKPEPVVKKQKAQLARGLETDSMAQQSRIAVRQEREREKKEEAEARAEAKAAKKAAKKEAKAAAKAEKKAAGKINGEVDAKKDPKKAKRQKDHIKKKQEARAAAPKKEANPNEVTVAEICRELDIDPKVGRAKLRRHKDKLAKLYAKGVTEGWTFPKASKADLVKILK